MTFIEFCESHGLIIKSLIANGRWQRVPTRSHPRSSNGAYIFNGESGACQDWATMETPSVYKSNHATNFTKRRATELRQAADDDKRKLQESAARKAGYILKNSTFDHHPYLIKKGFEELKGLVYERKLVIPMRKGDKLVGCQMIDESGDKRFLYGQETSLATHIIGSGDVKILCEGYGTGLSVKDALMRSGLKFSVIVCFSAGNMLKIAKTLKSGFVIADNDKSGTGQRVAAEIGFPFWISPNEGNDFNDDYTKQSRFRLSQELKKLLINKNG